MIENYPRTIILKDSTECLFRPVTENDKSAVAEFFTRVDPDDLWVLNRDYTKPEAVDFFYQCLNPGENIHILAISGEKILGMGSIHFTTFGARKHIGDVLILIDRDAKQKRLGSWIMLELISIASSLGLEILKIELVAGKDDAAIVASKRVNFIPQGTLKNYLQDRNGRWLDLIILIKEIHESWSDY
ncbi:MAG TPA: GNAT family N-acetyltransferase [Spirochaetota bacterium]|nr:GNAT family N-acetyltransferase [Spirochaetota bacterium]HPJ40497.1 GNAT family N-acetyltransferase [Spirochaetota bacterium]HPQ53438.1 GNAT family N-acetyltransferase [Spirochaetota bacterium]